MHYKRSNRFEVTVDPAAGAINKRKVDLSIENYPRHFTGRGKRALGILAPVAPRQRVVSFGGYEYHRIDSPVKHDFTFTPAMSLFVDATSEAQLAELFTKLSAGGKVLMPLDNYGFSRKFGWVSDRFGVSWQLNLPKIASGQ